MFDLTQIMKSPTLISFSSTSLFDQILAKRISHAGVISEMLPYRTTNLFIALGILAEFKIEVCTKKKIPFTHELRDLYF